MAIKLAPMDQKTFEAYYERSLKDYADEHIRAGSWGVDEAPQKAREQFAQLLPDGLASKNHFLFSVKHDKESIGILWLYVTPKNQEKQAFIYDVELEEGQRGNGYGKATMNALDEYAKAEGITQIRLHVFAHNKRAIALYEKMGYEMTNHYMLKKL